MTSITGPAELKQQVSWGAGHNQHIATPPGDCRTLRPLRRLIEEAPTTTVRWDLLTIAARDAHHSL